MPFNFNVVFGVFVSLLPVFASNREYAVRSGGIPFLWKEVGAWGCRP